MLGVLNQLLLATWPPSIVAALPLALLGFALSGNVDRSPQGRLFLTVTLVGLAGVLFSVMALLLPD